jgi:ATP-binding cassette, subfamily B, bacterial
MKEKIKLFREALKLVWVSTRSWTSFNITLTLIRSIFPLIIIWLLKIVIDDITRAVSTGSAAVNVVLPVILVAAAWFLDEATSDLGNYVRKKQAFKLESYMYDLLHAKSIRLDLINFENPEYFDCLSRASKEAPWRPNNILNNLLSLFRGTFSLLMMGGLLLSLHWSLGLVLLIANIPGIWLRLHYSGLLYNFQKLQTPEARKSAYFNWLLTGDRPSRELRLFGLGNYFRELFRNSFINQKEKEIDIIKRKTIIDFVADLFKALSLLFVLLFIVHQTINKNISIGQMSMSLLAFRQGMLYIKDMLGSMAGLYEDSLFIGDTFEFLNLKEKVIAVDPVSIPSTFREKIVAENLSFTYPGNSSATIKNISFEINKGEIVALVGPNGAGKSTLVRLLCRLYDPDSGSIRIDSKDIRNIDPDFYRRQFSVVFQDFMLYNLSAGENIRMGNVEEPYSIERIESAAKEAGVHNLLKDLPSGYDTRIGNLFEDSRELSWGEWQKIAMARALYRNSPVLILDEPSSALDADTEHEIFTRFREIVKDRTCVIISHRFTNVSLADRIIVLDRGEIAETGTHDGLMQKNGLYANMYSRQKSRFQE